MSSMKELVKKDISLLDVVAKIRFLKEEMNSEYWEITRSKYSKNWDYYNKLKEELERLKKLVVEYKFNY